MFPGEKHVEVPHQVLAIYHYVSVVLQDVVNFAEELVLQRKEVKKDKSSQNKLTKVTSIIMFVIIIMFVLVHHHPYIFVIIDPS